MKYDKPHASLDEQIERLQKRGMLIKDVDTAKHELRNIGYYRLSSYWYRFETPPVEGHRTHNFRPGVTFDDVFKLYVFDQRLRVLLLEAIERLEISMRAVWAEALSEVYGPHALLESKCFSDKDVYFQGVAKLIQSTARARNSSAEIQHYLKTYCSPLCPPIWLAISVMTFGEVLRWLKNTDIAQIKGKVARAFGFPNANVMIGTFRSILTVRNMCAHQERLWDSVLITRMPLITKHFQAPMVTLKQKDQIVADARMYNYLLVLGHLMINLNNDTSWPHRIASLVKSSLTKEQQRTMGFPIDWEHYDFWGHPAYLR